MKFDEILEHVGEFGGYQRFLVLLLYIPAMFAGMQALSYVFVSAIPKHRCFVKTCDNGTTSYVENFLNWTTPNDRSTSAYSSCTIYGAQGRPVNESTIHAFDHSCPNYVVNYNRTEDCHNWKFDRSTYQSTVVTQWQLVCDHSNLVALSQSAYMVGVMIGSIAFGTIADRFGRKNAMVFGLLVAAAASTVIPFVPYYPVYLVLKVVIGASCQGFYQTVFVMSVEIVGKSKRALCGMLVSIYFSFGEVILGVLAYYIRDWRVIQLAISIPLLSFVSYYWLIPESPRWMISNNQLSDAKKILDKIAKSNKKTVPYNILNAEDVDIVGASVEETDSRSSSVSVGRHNFLDLFRTPRLRWRTLNIIFNWFMNTVAYYGITMSSPNLGGNEFYNFIIISAIEVPAYVFCILVLDRVGRRLPLCLCMIVGGLAGTCTSIVPATPEFWWLSISLALVGKFGAAAAFGIIYVFTAELFPTVIRNNGIGLSSMVGHAGGAIAPYIATLSTYNKALPLTIYGIFSLFAGLTALTLPETLNQQLPESVKDAEEFGRKDFRKVVIGSAQSERFYLLSDANDEEVSTLVE